MVNVKHYKITRANLRNLIRFLSYTSVILFGVNNVEIAVAFLVLGAGCVVHFITKGVLIRNVVMCNNGIYGVVRHPYYMANYLIDVSFCLLSGNPYLVLVYPFLFFWVYGPTLRKEEKYLAATHNEPYIEYLLDVPQVFPDSYFTKYVQGIFSGFSKKRISRNEISRIMRFWATAFFICFLHTLKSINLHINLFFSVFMMLAVIFYVASIFVRGKR
jgi:protein-S-isoprenylcysteine O-methyltransferase Ste14